MYIQLSSKCDLEEIFGAAVLINVVQLLKFVPTQQLAPCRCVSEILLRVDKCAVKV